MYSEIISAEELSKKIKDKKIIIYGAHQVAKEFYEYLKYHGMERAVLGFAVTNIQGNPTEIEGLEVKEIAEYLNHTEDSVVYVATPEKFISEICENLSNFGFNDVVSLGLKGLAKLEIEKIVPFINNHFPSLNARECENEYCCIELDVNHKTRRLLCLGAYPLNDKSKEALTRFEDGIFDEPLCCENIEKRDGSAVQDITTLVVGGYGQIAELKNLHPFEHPIVVGLDVKDEALREKTKNSERHLIDSEGINISEKNSVYAEMTATYWLWKNNSSQYKGLSHYRRRFVFDKSAENRILSGTRDVFLSSPRVILPSLAESFGTNTSLCVEDFLIIEKAVKKLHPDIGSAFKTYYEGTFFYPTNMLIAKKEVFDGYCEWIFEILFMIEKDEEYKELRRRNRYNAYVAEVLTSFYFIYYSSKFSIDTIEYRMD